MHKVSTDARRSWPHIHHHSASKRALSLVTRHAENDQMNQQRSTLSPRHVRTVHSLNLIPNKNPPLHLPPLHMRYSLDMNQRLS